MATLIVGFVCLAVGTCLGVAVMALLAANGDEGEWDE